MWDERIDDVAQRMTAGQPRANLRTRILERIETPARRRSWSPLVAVPAAATAVAAALLVVFALSTQHHNTPPSTKTPAAGQATPASPLANVSASPVEARPAALPATATTMRTARNLQRVEQAQEVIVGEEALLSPPLSIHLEPLDLATLPAIESIVAEPLDIATLDIEPFDQQTDRQRQ